jgi:predicted N-formylglutamate amidohydrolase
MALGKKLTERRTLFNSFQKPFGGLVSNPDDSSILTDEDGPAVWTERAGAAGPFLIICDHASNTVPVRLGDLGLGREALASHAAWDPGAYGVSEKLADLLDSPLISARFSRLAYDVNRPPSSPEAMRAVSEIYEIPGNQHLTSEQRAARIAELYEPFHEAIEAEIDARSARGLETVLVTVHSFTPVYFGRAREVQLGILYDSDARLADQMIAGADRLTSLVTRRNEPYGPQDGVTHTLHRHAIARGLLNVMIEIRNDLVRTAAEQAQIAALLAAMLRQAVAETTDG